MKAPEQPETPAEAAPAIPVETRILGWGAETIPVALPSARLTVVELIRAKIRAEWAARERGERDAIGRESTAPEMLSRRIAAEPVSLEASIRTAVDGYRSGWYIVMVDGEEPGGLDSVLTLRPDSAVAFVRVYPLPDAPRR